MRETDGRQPGDPDRAADAIVALVNAPNPPLRLPMGEAALEGIRRKIDAMAKDLETWRDLSLSTDYPDAKA
jgi:hypothetical protein